MKLSGGLDTTSGAGMGAESETHPPGKLAPSIPKPNHPTPWKYNHVSGGNSTGAGSPTSSASGPSSAAEGLTDFPVLPPPGLVSRFCVADRPLHLSSFTPSVLDPPRSN